MNRDELLETLLVERYAPNPNAMFEAAAARANDDSDITTARRRRQLSDATEPERKRDSA